MATPRSLYRGLLREIHHQYPRQEQMAVELRAMYDKNTSVTDQAKISSLQRQAENVFTFLKSTRKHNELRQLYSAIVMEQKKKLEMSAHRVGLELPKQYHPEETSSQPSGTDKQH